MGLGPYPTVSLAEARLERDKWEAVLKAGDDPIMERDKERIEKEAIPDVDDPTFARAAEITFEAKKEGLRRGGKSGKWMSPIRLYMVPAIGDKKMSEIKQTDIQAALSPIWKAKHPTAEKAIQRTRIIFKHMRPRHLRKAEPR